MEEPTDQDYREALRRHLALFPFVLLLAAVIGFIAFLIGYGSVTTGLYGIPCGLLMGSVTMSFISRFCGGPDDPKFKAAKKRLSDGSRLERPGTARERDLKGMRPATWQKFAFYLVGGAMLFAVVFFVWSGFKAEMAIGGLVMGALFGMVMFVSTSRKARG